MASITPPFPSPDPESNSFQALDLCHLSHSNLNHRTQRTLIKYFQDLPTPETSSPESSSENLVQRRLEALAISGTENSKPNVATGNKVEAEELNGALPATDVNTDTAPEEEEGPKTITIERPRSRPKLVFMGQRR
jgi:hypothetical protein